MQIPLRIPIAGLLAADGKLVARDHDFKLFGGETRDREDQTQDAAATLGVRDSQDVSGRVVIHRGRSGRRTENALQPVDPKDDRRLDALDAH